MCVPNMRSVYKQIIVSFIKCFPLQLSPQLLLQNVTKINLGIKTKPNPTPSSFETGNVLSLERMLLGQT